MNGNMPGGVFISVLGLSFLVGFSIAGYFLDFPRLYFYGILVASALPVGEWLYRHLGAAHHGLPITFGITSGIMILIGIITRLFYSHRMGERLSVIIRTV